MPSVNIFILSEVSMQATIKPHTAAYCNALLQEIAEKTRELLDNLKCLGTSDVDGKLSITTQQLQEKRLPHATENFLLGLAAAEGLLQL